MSITNERISEIYQETFNSMPDRARDAPKTPPLVLEFARRILSEAALVYERQMSERETEQYTELTRLLAGNKY